MQPLCCASGWRQGWFCNKLTGLLLQLSLRSAGYSYLTMSNLVQVLLNPISIISLLLLGALLAVFLTLELAALVTSYQGAAYSRRVGGS